MISASLLTLHVLAAVIAFFKYGKVSRGEGWMAVAFFAIFFAVGWTLTTMLVGWLFNFRAIAEWHNSLEHSAFGQVVKRELPPDTISLLLLTTGEAVFYYFFLRSEKGPVDRTISA